MCRVFEKIHASLTQLSVIQAVSVSSISQNSILIKVSSTATRDALVEALKLIPELQADESSDDTSTTLHYQWVNLP